MACYHPVKAWKGPHGVYFAELRRYGDLQPIELPCGQCIGCRARRAQDWTLRCMHEAQLWEDNCFVTLTYGRDKVPANGSLCYADFQLFMRRVRARHAPLVRFFMCGEYGPLNGRPHYHACLFNCDFRDRVVAGKASSGSVFFSSKLLDGLWGHGRASVQPLNKSTAGYCAQYVCKKLTGQSRDDFAASGRVPEFGRCSLKPGIGADWYRRFGGDVFRSLDSVVADGQKFSPPRYYDKLRKRGEDVFDDDRIEFERVKRAKLGFRDQTAERLEVREVVHNARLVNRKRDSV